MALVIEVKNTFFTIKTPEEPREEKRSTSLPRSWKHKSDSENKLSDASDSSTVIPDDLSLPGDRDVSDTDKTSDEGSPPCELRHMERVSRGGAQKTRLKLSAPAYAPATEPIQDAMSASCELGFDEALPPEVHDVILAVKMALCCCTQVSRVFVRSGSMGAATHIHAVLEDFGQMGAYGVCQALGAAQAALMDATARSQNVYMLGHGAQPFQEHESGFRGTLSIMPTSIQHKACWDVYQHGCCPRRQTCRWSHPSKLDMMEIHVTIEQQVESLVGFDQSVGFDCHQFQQAGCFPMQ